MQKRSQHTKNLNPTPNSDAKSRCFLHRRACSVRIGKGDDLSADTLPEEKPEDILTFIRTANVIPLDTDDSTEPLPPCIKRVFPVRKTISEDFFTGVFGCCVREE